MFRQRKHKIQKSMKKNNFFRGMLPILAVGVMALAGTSLTSCSRSSDDEQVEVPVPAEKAIVGTWKLVKNEQKDTDGVYKEALLQVLYRVYGADKTFKYYINRAPGDPGSSPALEGSYELKEGKIIQKTSYGQEIILTQKIEGNTLVQINQTDTTRLTFTKQ